MIFHALSLLAASLSLAIVPGDPIPADLAAPNQDGKVVQFSALKGKPVLVYFYPKDDTPGCTKQACDLRDRYVMFQKRGAVVLGVSRQDAKSHQEFRKKYDLPFDLLVDSDGKVASALGIETMPIVGFHKRQSVLIGPDGKLVRVYRDVDPAKHAPMVLADLEGLAGKGEK